MNIKRIVATVAMVWLAACAGGGMSGTPQTPAAPAGPGSRPMGTVTFTITIPGTPSQSIYRSPMFVSPNTQSIVIQQLDTSSSHNPVGGPVTVNVTSRSNGCTTVNTTVTCSVTFPAPAGTFDFSVKTYSATNAGGSLLSENTLTTYTVIAGQANTISVTLNGVIASIGAGGSISGTLSAPQTLDFTPADATGAAIVGPGTYDNGPLTIADQSGLVTATPSSFNGPSDGTSSSIQCRQPGNGTLQFADASGNLSTVRYTCTSSAISVAPGSLDFNAVASSSSDGTYDQNVTATDPNPSPAITWLLSCTPSGSVSVVGSGPTVAIRPLVVGTCTLLAKDQYGAASNTINIVVHATSITIHSHKRH
jgi:hypothetical protein